MMDALFLKLLNMSITAGWLVFAVLLIRPLLQKAPKALHCALWAVVAVRLLCPFSFESVFSLIPAADPIPPNILYSPQPNIQSGVPLIDNAVNPILSESLSPNPGDSVNPLQVLTAVAANVWLLGVVAMLIYAVISYIRVYRQVRVHLPLQPRVYECDAIRTPFIFGLFRPCIYLPSSLSPSDRTYVIAHEQAHLKRLDHIWKPLGFALLTVYWFNPLLWVAYILLCRDIELACDEHVIRNMDKKDTAAYTEALLHCSSKQTFITACPLAFGESGVKTRIKNALHYKKPAFWIVLLAVITCIAVAVCFLTNPNTTTQYGDGDGSELDGLSLVIEDLDLSADKPSIIVRFENQSGKQLLYGESFRLYRLEGDCKIDTNLVINSGFNAIGYHLNAFDSKSETYSLIGYNLSQNGIYRFETHVNLQRDGTQSYAVWVEFTIENGTLASPLIATDDNFTIESDELLYQNARVTYPILKSDQKDYSHLNGFLKNNIEARLYDIGKAYPKNSTIDMTYRITYRDNTIVSVLFEGSLTQPSGDITELAFTACLAPGNGYTVNPESLIDLSTFALEKFRKQWLALWNDANLTY